MELIWRILSLLLCAVITITGSSAILLQHPENKPYLLTAKGLTNFTNKFLPVLLNHVQTRNVIYSPLSVHAMLINTYLEAEGETKNELKSVACFLEYEDAIPLGFRVLLDTIERSEKIAIARTVNDVWIENKFSINPKFNSSSHRCCSVDADVFNANILGESLNKINAKMEDKTHGLVKNILNMDDLNSANTVAVSSTYFIGEWLHKFHYSPSNEKTIFHVSETEGTMVHMMHVVGKFNTGRVLGLNADYIELPFKNFEVWGRKRALTMFIIRPDSFKDLEQVVNNLEKINIPELDADPQSLNVFLPQFKVESKLELKQAMKEVGIQKIFDVSGELNIVKENASIPLDVFMHKVTLDIGETGVNTHNGRGVIKPPDANDYPKFWVDSPFLAIILDNESKAYIFVARIIHPNEWLLRN